MKCQHCGTDVDEIRYVGHVCTMLVGKAERFESFCTMLVQESQKLNPAYALLDVLKAYKFFWIIRESFDWAEAHEFWERLEQDLELYNNKKEENLEWLKSQMQKPRKLKRKPSSKKPKRKSQKS